MSAEQDDNVLPPDLAAAFPSNAEYTMFEFYKEADNTKVVGAVPREDIPAYLRSIYLPMSSRDLLMVQVWEHLRRKSEKLNDVILVGLLTLKEFEWHITPPPCLEVGALTDLPDMPDLPDFGGSQN